MVNQSPSDTHDSSTCSHPDTCYWCELERNSQSSTLTDADKAALTQGVVQRARDDLNDGRPLTEMGGSRLTPVERRILQAMRRDRRFASFTTVRAAVADLLDVGEDSIGCTCEAQRHAWVFSLREDEYETARRGRFIDAMTARIVELQSSPHDMDMRLRTDALDSQQFYELMQAYRHAPMADQPGVVAAFEAVQGFVRNTQSHKQG